MREISRSWLVNPNRAGYLLERLLITAMGLGMRIAREVEDDVLAARSGSCAGDLKRKQSQATG